MSPQEKRASERSAQQAKSDEVKNTKNEKQQARQDKIDSDAAARDERAKLRREVQDRADERQKNLLTAREKDRELKKQESDRKREKVKQNAEDNKKKALERNVRSADAAVKDRTAGMKRLTVGFDNVEKDDGLGTAFSKFGGNMTQIGQKVARGTTAFAKRELKDRPALRRARRELDNFGKKKPETKTEINTKAKEKPKQKAKVSEVPPKQKVQKAQKALPASAQKALPAGRSQKALPPGRSQKALPAARTKSLPGGATKFLPKITRASAAKDPLAKAAPNVKKPTSPTKASAAKDPLAKAAPNVKKPVSVDNQRASKRAQTTSSGDYASKADRIAAFKKRRDADKAAGVKMREEFIQEVKRKKEEKVKKIIDILKGKNKIETMPKVSESADWRDDYIPTEFETVDLIKPEPLKPSNWRKDIEEASAAWTKKSGKNSEGGLNEKGRKSYERENPGSDLKAPSKKVGNPRRKSFCARMKGMKSKLTSAKTANDPNSRINKSLRAWNC